ncbi:MAG: 50S ribosomal protein L15e [Nanoarchaeota archaeon]
MVKGSYYYQRETWKNPDNDTLKQRMVEWRKSPVIVRVEKPLKLHRAHELGYKAKKGIIVVRVRLIRGGRKKPRPEKGRRSKRMTIKKILKMNYREVAEQRVARKYPNMEVINSYQIGKDGMHYFFEVILADRNAPEIKSDKQLSYVSNSPKNKSFRGITSAGKRARGLRNSSIKAPKVRPSLRANRRRGN